MSDAAVVRIAKAVAAKLAASSFSQPHEPVARVYLPEFESAQLGVTRIVVMARSETPAAHTRQQDAFDIAVQVGVLRRVDKSSAGLAAEIDGLLKLVEELYDVLRNRTTPHLADVPDAAWLGVAHDTLYDPKLLHEQGVFFSLMTVRYGVAR